MGKINILDSSVFNMLAAGEVVERPASVVKELVENSIDAGASVIDITIEEGGTRLIEVSDNGIGVAREDMRAAFLPHATSKLKEIVDLDSLSTLGFRGEALASIASVSEVTMVSMAKGADMASKIVLSGGKIISEGMASRDAGTAITVENLFFNTPARLKFLKKPSLEQKYVEDTVRRLILANPELSISLTADGQSVIAHRGGSLFDAAVSVYGAKNADLIEIPDNSRDGIRVRGYVSAPDKTKSTRSHQTIIINGRCVTNQTVQTAAEKAYDDLLMKHNYPIFVIDVIMPFEQVDVNVHPSKTEVRFANVQAVFGAVYHAVHHAIHSIKNSPNEPEIMSANAVFEAESEQTPHANATSAPYLPRVTAKFHSTPPTRQFSFRESAIGAYDDFFAPSDSQYAEDNDTSIGADLAESEDVSAPAFDGNIVGQIFATYLIVERDDVVYIIDQHAAHERLLYDKIYSRTVPEFSQPLLIPYKLSLSAEETERFEELTEPLKQIGFEIAKQGANYIIEAVPEPISRINFGKFFSDLFKDGAFAEGISLAELIRDSLCQQACKAAIKGGEKLNRAQIGRVLATLTSKDGKLPEKCPHGRPAVVTLTKTDFEKLFKRIV